MLVDKLRPIVARSEEIEALLADSDLMSDVSLLAALSKERSDNEEVFRKSKEYLKVLDDISHSKSLLNDRELGELAKEELRWLELSKRSLEEEINVLLIPKDPNDGKNIFLEIRAGVGGDEACIFVGDLFGAYCRYADSKGWRVEIISSNENSLGGYKEIIVSIQGDRVYSNLKFESGTHRVQRVPKTESQGRVHTSAVTVAIMPEADDVEVSLSPSDVKVDVFRSGGHGGQSVNTTDSAVRVTHVPTGITVCIQDEKSQHKNKEKAMRILRSKLYELEIDAQNRENDRNRKMQVGSGDRSERVRTYNYPQNRLTDHRINLTIYSLEEVMLSGDLDKMVLPLIASFHSSALAK